MRLIAIIVAVFFAGCRGSYNIDETGPNCFNGDHEACRHLETQCKAGMDIVLNDFAGAVECSRGCTCIANTGTKVTVR